MKSRALTSTCLVMAAAAALALGGCKPPKGGTGQQPTGPEPAQKVKVDFYIMSQCPFGVQVQKGIKPVLDKLGKAVDFSQDFIGNDMGGGSFGSLHGEPEVQGNIVQLCAAKAYPESHKYMDFVACVIEDYHALPGNWKGCAQKTGLDAAKLQACIDGPEGKALLSASFKKAQMARAGGSPTVFVGGEKYNGGREEKDFLNIICCGFDADKKPAACPKAEELTCPKHVPVDLIVIGDKRCKDCEARSNQTVSSLQDRFFPKVNVRKVDYNDAEGKELYAKVNAKLLPAYVFAQNVKEDSGYETFQRWLAPVGDYFLSTMSNSNFDPTKEICDNQVDDTANGKVDCDDDDCRNQLVCREEKPNSVDLFIMSGCPFGIRALDNIKPVLDLFKTSLNFKVRFIVDMFTEEDYAKLPAMDRRKAGAVKKGDGNYYYSMHGEWELDENLREACAQKYYAKGNKFMDYYLCRNKDIKNPDWKACAAEAKIDAARIEKCSTGKEGLDIMREDAKLGDDLNFGASPTFLGNNKKQMPVSQMCPDGIKKAICAMNADLKGCEVQLPCDAPEKGGKAPSCG